MNTRYNKKILSIIIPAYNSGKWIVKTLESVDYKYQDNFEILVVDDGSTIAWKHKINLWLRKYPHCVKYIRKQNSNWGGVFNFALKRAQGTYIKILDSDDEFDQKYFNDYLKLLSICTKHNVDVVISSYYFAVSKNNKIVKRKYRLDSSNSIIFSSFDKLHSIKLFTHHCLTITRKMAKQFKTLPEHCFYSDVNYSYQSVINAKRVALLPSHLLLYRYNIHDTLQSISFSSINKKIDDVRLVFHSMLNIRLAKNISHNRATLLLACVQSLFYLIMICVAGDGELYHFQKKAQVMIEISYLEVYSDRREFRFLINTGFATLIKHFPKRIIFKFCKFIINNWPTGYLNILRQLENYSSIS